MSKIPFFFFFIISKRKKSWDMGETGDYDDPQWQRQAARTRLATIALWHYRCYPRKTICKPTAGRKRKPSAGGGCLTASGTVQCRRFKVGGAYQRFGTLCNGVIKWLQTVLYIYSFHASSQYSCSSYDTLGRRAKGVAAGPAQ